MQSRLAPSRLVVSSHRYSILTSFVPLSAPVPRHFDHIQARKLHACTHTALSRERHHKTCTNGNTRTAQERESQHRRPVTRGASRTLTQSTKRQYDTKHVAVLGGGITGLSACYHLLKRFPGINVTLYEGSDKLGGWAHTKRIDTPDGHIYFEQGPRTLRLPGSPLTLAMIKTIGMFDELIFTSKQADAARNRFVYWPDRLRRIPHPTDGLPNVLSQLLVDPMFSGLLWGCLTEILRPGRVDGVEDESVGHFLERRLGTSAVADNVASAVFHGIYAGDIYQLSMKSIAPRIWQDEKVHNCFIAPQLMKAVNRSVADSRAEDPSTSVLEKTDWTKTTGMSVYSFKRGIGSFVEALEQHLGSYSNFKVRKGAVVTGLSYDYAENKVKVSDNSDHDDTTYNNIISTISAQSLATLPANKEALQSLASMHSVTVMVINLFYADASLLPVRGFGYLLPQSVPLAQNPERALGVLFDSYAAAGQDSAAGTKVTVMLGGHWWDGFSGRDCYPSDDEGLAMARAVLERHLGVAAPPLHAHASLQRDCIPQYTVGHDARMARAHGQLAREFRGRLAVAGNSYTGVGVHDCMDAAQRLVGELDLDSEVAYDGVTGLERFTKEQEMN